MTYTAKTKKMKTENKKKLNQAFAALRKAGYTAKQNFLCCQSCAWNALSNKEAEKAVFYHQQDADDLKETGIIHLAWSGNGKEIVKILKEHGLDVEWEGSDNKRIVVDLN
jgi:hypothetical protein